MHHTCFAKIFGSFISVMILKTFRFKSFVLCGTQILLGRSLRVRRQLYLTSHVHMLRASYITELTGLKHTEIK